MIRYLSLAEYFWLAGQVTGVEAAVLGKASRVDLAESALHAAPVGPVTTAGTDALAALREVRFFDIVPDDDVVEARPRSAVDEPEQRRQRDLRGHAHRRQRVLSSGGDRLRSVGTTATQVCAHRPPR